MNFLVKSHNEKHKFALFIASLSCMLKTVSSGKELLISDEKLSHRMMHVLRLAKGDGCIFFDQMSNAYCTIKEFIGKKQVLCIINKKEENIVLLPRITFLLPLLKRDDYEQALYTLTEVGVSTIQLVSTDKTHGMWSGQKDSDRAHRIIVSAAEQSKNFAYPELKAPISLALALEIDEGAIKIFFDPQGTSLFCVMQKLRARQYSNFILLIGPEGDLSAEEKEMIVAKGFLFCALTPTILRAVQAAALSAGLVRSLLT